MPKSSIATEQITAASETAHLADSLARSASEDSASVPVPVDGGGEDLGGTRLVTILYSRDRDLYRVPSIDKLCWLSVKAYELPAAQLAADAIYLGPSVTADGKHWRKAFSTSWRSIVAGDRATIPADDPMVADYACAAFTSGAQA